MPTSPAIECLLRQILVALQAGGAGGSDDYMVYSGAHENSYDYVESNVVIHLGRVWICTNNHFSTAEVTEPATGADYSDYWDELVAAIPSSAQMMQYYGQWNTALAYPIFSVVRNSGITYICISAHTSGENDEEPGVGVNWTTYWETL